MSSQITYKKIATIQRNTGNGVTEPKYATSTDNEFLVVKTHNNPETDIVLFNEYFFYKLALLVNLPMPASGIGLIDDDTVIHENCISSDQKGYCFYSSYLHNFPINKRIVDSIKNLDDFYKMVLFDHIIFNLDRNIGNIILKPSDRNKLELVIIDHTHALVGQSLWNSKTLKRAMEQNDYYGSDIMNSNKILYKIFIDNIRLDLDKFKSLSLTFKKKITEEYLNKTISEIPNEWLPKIQDMDLLIKYIIYRVQHIDDICYTIKKILSKHKGD